MNFHGLQNVRDYEIIESTPGPRSHRSRCQRRLAVEAFDCIDVVQPLRFGEL